MGNSELREVIGLKQIAHLLPQRVSEIQPQCPAREFAGALSGFDGYFDGLLQVCSIQQETVNEISSPCATTLFIPISL